MRTTTKRLLSLVMVIALMLTLAPMSVFAAGTKTVYFQNNWMWSDVCVHYWGSSSPDTTWPGVRMTKVGTEANYDVYKAEIPADVTGIVINGVKDDGSGNRDQTPDITNIQTGVCYYMVWENGNAVATFPYGTPVDPTDPSTEPTTPIDPIDPPNPDVTVDDIQDGTTLHCWNWSFADIEKNMAKIAEQGYTAIQTSPIQQAKEPTVGNGMKSHWWVFYQPANFYIDTTTGSALGTKAQFESMCKTAHKYGVKVIVDVVANHLGNKTGNNLADTLDPDIKNDSSCWHDISKNTTNYNDRYDITQHCMAGLPDLNTSNKKIQDYALNFLKECIDAGADGFRFDGAKHIETPDDSNCGSNFWPYVINGATEYAKTSRGIDLYCYGEVLDAPGGGLSINAYTKYMSVTDNSWGNNVRHAVTGRNAGGYSSNYHKTAKANQLVVWAESHDTYANDSHESTYVSVANINKTWALVAARADAMGLYFARPANFDSAKLGQGDVTGWSYPEVKAVNQFHNYFVGTTEYLANENGIAYCERGGKGVVLVNCSGDATSVNVKSNTLANGTYVDAITGNTFTVSSGRISGQIGNTGIAVVYQGKLPCQHTWKDATCTAPKTCTKCGETSGTALNHSWNAATCTAPKTCTKCGATEGKELGHSWNDATCTAPKTCSKCGTTEGKELGHSWNDATCTAPKTCSKCGTTEGKELGHSYVNGTCGTCDAADPNYKPVVEKFDIAFSQIDMGNALGMNFAFPAVEGIDFTGAYAEATMAGSTQTIPADKWTTATIGGKAHYVFSYSNIAAKQMADEVTIVIYNANKEAISNEYIDSIQSYVMRNVDGKDAESKALMIDMLNYGAAAQSYYKYNVTDLANALLTDAQKAYGTSTKPAITDIRVKGANYLGTRLELGSSIGMQMNFAGTTADMYAVIEFTNHSGKKVYERVDPTEISGNYLINITQVAVADGRMPVTVTVYNANGTVYGTATDSMASYIARMSNADSLYENIMKFSDSAYAYLH